MITTSLLLGGLTVGGFYFLFHRMPARAQIFLTNRPLFTDAVAAVLTYTLFQGTILGLFAAAWSALIVSLMLSGRKNKLIMSYLHTASEKWGELLQWVETFGEKYSKKEEKRDE